MTGNSKLKSLDGMFSSTRVTTAPEKKARVNKEPYYVVGQWPSPTTKKAEKEEKVMKADIIPMVIDAGDSLVDNAELRAQLIERTEVLDKVKNLLLIPGLEMMTTRQVADFYEVGYEAIKACYLRNVHEIIPDGSAMMTKDEFNDRIRTVHDATVKNLRGRAVVEYAGISVDISNRGTLVFTQRAILRIGMLLRDSEVAKEVRTQLLNGFKRLTPEQKVEDVNTEQTIGNNFLQAFISGDTVGAGKALTELNAFKNKCIDELKKENEAVTAENEALTSRNEVLVVENDVLAGLHLTTSPRKLVNRIIRSIACRGMGGVFSAAWRLFAKELYYDKGIYLNGRKKGKLTLMDVVKEDEWKDVVMVAASI